MGNKSCEASISCPTALAKPIRSPVVHLPAFSPQPTGLRNTIDTTTFTQDGMDKVFC